MREGWSAYSECDARCSASHCSLIQPRLAEFTPPGTRILGRMTAAINAMTAPTMNSIVLAATRQRVTILTRGTTTVCAFVHTRSERELWNCPRDLVAVTCGGGSYRSRKITSHSVPPTAIALAIAMARLFIFLSCSTPFATHAAQRSAEDMLSARV